MAHIVNAFLKPSLPIKAHLELRGPLSAVVADNDGYQMSVTISPKETSKQ